MTFADALNENNVLAVVENGCLFLVDDNGDAEKVGDFCVLQANAGPDLRLGDDGRLSVCAEAPVLDGDTRKTPPVLVWATFDGHRWA